MITQYKIGDKVQWAYRNYGSHGAGTGDQIILSGEVVEIVPPCGLPTQWANYAGADHYNRRSEESYVVRELSGNILRPNIELLSLSSAQDE